MWEYVELIEKMTSISHDLQIKLLTSLIIAIFLWMVRTLAISMVWKRTEDVRVRYIWQKTITYIVVILGLLLVSPVWFDFTETGTYLGLLSAGLAIALKDVVANIVGWLFIILRRPFTVGDRIQIDNNAGDVIDIRLFQFTLMEIGNWVDADQSTGRIIHIPNGWIFTKILANYSKGFQYIWNEIPVLLTFESNWKKAKKILEESVNKHAEYLSKPAEEKVREARKKFLIFYSKLTPAVYTSVKDSGVLLTIRYLCKPRDRRDSEQSIWEDILQEFGKCKDIDFAYPTQRFYNSLLEGKSGTKTHSPKGDTKPS